MNLDEFLERDIEMFLDNVISFGSDRSAAFEDEVGSLLQSAPEKEGELLEHAKGERVVSEEVDVQAKNIVIQSPVEGQKETQQQRDELSKIVKLEDTLNDLKQSIEEEKLEESKKIRDDLRKKTSEIAYNPAEKEFLEEQLKMLSTKLDELLRRKEGSEAEHEDVKLPEEHVVEGQSYEEMKEPEKVTIAASALPDTKKYLEAVEALHKRQKVKALEMFLELAKEHPKNLAIKIHLKEATEL